MSEHDQALEDLRLIRRMIDDTRQTAGQLWVYLSIWGGLGIVASIVSHWLVLLARYEQISSVWGLYVLVGGVLSFAFARRIGRQERVLSFVDRSLAMTWIAIGITIVLLMVASLALGAAASVPPFVAFLLGAGLFISGALIEWRPLYAAAVIWWVGGLVMLMRPHEVFLIETVLLLGGYLVPAYILSRQPDRRARGDAPTA
jgi:hypothetical protein